MHDTRATDPAYGYTTHLAGGSFDDARARTVDALNSERFGVRAEIDVTAILKARLDRDFRRYVIGSMRVLSFS
jgi:uncharacterized protein (DUF302 family)